MTHRATRKRLRRGPGVGRHSEALDMLDTAQCNPALQRRVGEPCLPHDALQRIVHAWNKTHPRHKIPVRATTRKASVARRSGGEAATAVTAVTSDTSWHMLRDRMKDYYKCDTEFCMVKKAPLDNRERMRLKQFFRPEKPAIWDTKPTYWLDSTNIEDVMRQYEQEDPTFDFIGPVPIDFDSMYKGFGRCIVDELCKLDLRQAAASGGKQKIGIVFNLDPHDEPGSHWVCAYVDIPGKTAYYFDSYGYKPPKEIERFLRRCKEQGCENVYYNDIRHQRKGSECGMYCLFCIICLLHGSPFHEICKKIVDDDTMNAFRDILFAEERPRRAAIEDALPRLCHHKAL
jgi:hypothetical protein